jgi:hypothetical protein
MLLLLLLSIAIISTTVPDTGTTADTAVTSTTVPDTPDTAVIHITTVIFGAQRARRGVWTSQPA